jgi:hypothetical protein
MGSPQHVPHEPPASEQLRVWLVSAESKHVELQRLLLHEPFYSPLREAALRQEWDLLQEALDEVRALNANLQEASQGLCTRSHALRQRSTALGKRIAQARMQRSEEGLSPEDRHSAE